MTHRHLTSRKVVLTAAFLALAAGGTAACDASAPDEGAEGSVAGPGDTAVPTVPVTTRTTSAAPTRRVTSSAPTRPAAAATTGPAATVAPVPVAEETVDSSGVDEVFYCADTDGQIVDEGNCEDDPDGYTYLFWHSPSYPRGLSTGSYLDGGEQFASGDSDARSAYLLPASGRISNGTIKTNVVGRGSGTSGFDSSAGG